MKQTTNFRRFDDLSPASIRDAVSMADACLTENGIEREQRTRFRLLLEEVLTAYAGIAPGAPFRILTHRSYRKVHVRVYVKCAGFNCLEGDTGPIVREVLDGMAEKPEWKYRHGENILVFRPEVIVPGREELKQLLHYLDREKKSFRTGIALRLVNMLLLVVDPLLAARIIVAFDGSDLQKILLIALLIALTEAASGVVTYFAGKNMGRAYDTMVDDLQLDMARSVLQIKTEQLDAHSSGLFVQRVADETEELAAGIDRMLSVATEYFRLLALLIAFAVVSLPMLVFELVLFTLYILLVRRQAQTLNDDDRAVRALKERFIGFITEMVRAGRDVKQLHCEDGFFDRAKEVFSDYSERSGEMSRHSGRYALARSQFAAWANLLYLVILVVMMGRHGMTAATALVLYNYNGKAQAGARSLADATQDVNALLLSAERVCQLLRSRDFSREEFGAGRPAAIRGEIEMRDVHFSYRLAGGDSVPVLRGLSLHILPGETVALVGKSGCGKSTVLSLLTRLCEPSHGEILLDGTDLSELDRDSVRGSIGMVGQSPYLFNMSLRDNFAVVKKDLTEAEMIAACTAACVHDEIMEFTAGYDTVVGEGGVMLSESQLRRVALARCLLRDCPVVVIDGTGYAPDADTRRRIGEAVRNMRGRTVILADDRLSDVAGCDRLFLIEDGKVLASGTHSELMAGCEAYRSLCGEEFAAG